MLKILKLYLILTLADGEKHTINNLSKILAPMYNLIYEPPEFNPHVTLAAKPIPKIDITHALTHLLRLGLIEKTIETRTFNENGQNWSQNMIFYKITEKGKQTIEKIKQKWKEIDDLLETNHNTRKIEYAI